MSKRLLELADAYKEQIFTKLHELAPGRIARLDRSVFDDKGTEAVLALVYLQGVAEALDAFDVAELPVLQPQLGSITLLPPAVMTLPCSTLMASSSG